MKKKNIKNIVRLTLQNSEYKILYNTGAVVNPQLLYINKKKNTLAEATLQRVSSVMTNRKKVPTDLFEHKIYILCINCHSY